MMKSTGIVRKLDDLGRVVIPMELRRTMNIDDHAPMEIFSEGETIMMRQYRPGCALCGSMEGLVNDHPSGKLVCRKCLRTA